MFIRACLKNCLPEKKSVNFIVRFAAKKSALRNINFNAGYVRIALNVCVWLDYQEGES